MFQCQTVAQAKNYFRDSLSRADYYIQDQELDGHFEGKLAKQLGLEGLKPETEVFNKLCDNINPKTGENLTPRTVDDRRVGYDISFHCPKSVSILYGLTNNKKVLNAFEESVDQTMREIEQDIQTRIRIDNQYDDRRTGNLIWAGFTHLTARPVDGHSPDPHLHKHCFTFNATYDEVEDRIKAGQFHNIKRDMPYYQARFQKRLADKLSDLGHGIRKTKDAFELSVIPQKAIDFFSKRTNHIGQVAIEKGITNLKELDQLGARTRAKKQKNKTMFELKHGWGVALENAGIDGKVKEENRTVDKSHTPERSVDHAINHVFTRNSVKRDRQILGEAYKYAVDNRNISMDAVDQAFTQNDQIFRIQVGSQKLCTTTLVHSEERRMITLAREGMGKLRPLKADFDVSTFKHLNKEQQLVFNHVMTSQDRLTMIRGAAGTGKTTLLKTIVPEIEKSKKGKEGKKVFLFAPTAEASRDVLRKEGFENADTVARLLKDKSLQDDTKGQVIWIDEAGMLGSYDTSAILDLAYKAKARVIFSGDPRQHTAVLRGDGMRLLQSVGKMPIVSMEQIYRQKSDTYRQAVKSISKGNMSGGFTRLKEMGCIREENAKDIPQHLVSDYLKLRSSKKSALVITPTRANVKFINEKIRDGLKEQKKIASHEKSYTAYKNLRLTIAQKQDKRFYKKGQLIQTHQNIPGIKKGAKVLVDTIYNDQLRVIDKDRTHHILPLNKAGDYDVYSIEKIALSKGDEIRVTKNSYDKKGKRLDNATNLTIRGFDQYGNIMAVKESQNKKSKFLLEKDFGNFEYSYCLTSYGSQGKTVDQLLISQPSATFPATNQKQFYVSVSRARENVTIYTDNTEDLLSHIHKSGDRQGATELIDTDYFRRSTAQIDIGKDKSPRVSKRIVKEYEPEV